MAALSNSIPRTGAPIFNRAVVEARAEDFDAALEDYNAAIALTEGGAHATALAGRASLHVLREHPDRALTDCLAAIKIAPKSQRAWYWCGRAHAEKELWQDALVDFDTALRLDPKMADAYRRRGLVKKQLGDKADGEADIAKSKTES